MSDWGPLWKWMAKFYRRCWIDRGLLLRGKIERQADAIEQLVMYVKELEKRKNAVEINADRLRGALEAILSQSDFPLEDCDCAECEAFRLAQAALQGEAEPPRE